MGPTPLQVRQPPVHLGPVAHDHALKLLAQQFLHHRGGPCGAHREHRERGGHASPQPSFHGAFLRRRFIEPKDFLFGQLAGRLLVGRTQGGRRLVLQLHHPSRRTGLPQDLLQEQGHAPLRLPKATHQERHQSDQLRPGLTGRNARRQFGTRRDTARGAEEAMKLIFRHEGSDLRHLPDLMPQRLGVISCQSVTTAATGRRLERHHLAAFLGGDQGPFVLGMTGLAASFLPGRLSRRRGLGMRVLRTGRQRRILRGLVESRFQFLDPRDQQPDNGLRLRRLTSNHFSRKSPATWRTCRRFAPTREAEFLAQEITGRERLRAKGDRDRDRPGLTRLLARRWHFFRSP